MILFDMHVVTNNIICVRTFYNSGLRQAVNQWPWLHRCEMCCHCWCSGEKEYLIQPPPEQFACCPYDTIVCPIIWGDSVWLGGVDGSVQTEEQRERIEKEKFWTRVCTQPVHRIKVLLNTTRFLHQIF